MQQIVAGFASVENRIHSFFHNQNLGQLLRQSNVRKEKGVSLDTLFQLLLSLAFTGKNLFRLLESPDSPDGIGKDTAYRLLNSVNANWRRFLLLLSTRVIVQRLLPLTDETTTKVLIADDTLYRRDRSKRVELLARVHDHNTGRYVRGFRMLTLGWSDGNSFVPMMLSMLSSAKDKNRLAPMREGIDKRTNGYQRRRESMRKSTDVLVDMVALAMKAGTTARHLLFDSWFAFPATIRRIRALGMHTICMLKDTGKVTYEVQGWPFTLKELFKEVRKRPGRAKVLAEVLVTIGQDIHGKPVAAKIVFVRDRSSKKWLALLSTDTTLTAEEIITLYGRRWDIEVFFKMAKSFLNLAKEFQSRSFDALVAHATLVCCRYILLELVKRENADPRTLGSLFHALCDEIRRIGFTEAMALLLTFLEESLNSIIGLCKEQVQQLIQRFIETLPRAFRERMLLLAPVCS
ncbi:IS4-like element ISGur1 family transposase [Geotalea uraniireducens]|uniref:Transposase, IS4 family n=1 Tax=Geotalea uraniireducens (strain Rf4) TaxID=351605 RepID=A5G5A9_GEOUR|nr:IS4-like element ISGur1 family transposase [Geotalea uraniireducens]ABQ25044.1 transposase, IS4 family [Geotalea uraniireducens Rf4]ABQ25743.1 transposase, IS4 family [Geotalea uraniireducens Rf4]ABQ26977.1 transposase, IS4 family [Geotalea uraniireducens Rf4]